MGDSMKVGGNEMASAAVHGMTDTAELRLAHGGSDVAERHAEEAETATVTPIRGRDARITTFTADDLEYVDRTYYLRVIKPGLDVLAALVLLVLTAPLMAIIALGIRIVLGPNVVYRQQRVGRLGVDFTIYKFRTMRPDRRDDPLGGPGPYAGPERRLTHKSEDDPRHSRFGRVLRALSMDELPQLLNIAKGEMSLVGPRPELSQVADAGDLRYHRRHLVKPGLTGPWQVSAARCELISEGLDLDLDYVEDCTLSTDAKVMFQTVAALVRRTGA